MQMLLLREIDWVKSMYGLKTEVYGEFQRVFANHTPQILFTSFKKNINKTFPLPT